MHLGRTTLSKFLIQQLSSIEGASDLGALLIDVAAAVKAISAMTAKGALGGYLGKIGTTNVQGETQQKLDVLADDVLIKSCEWGGLVAGMASEEREEPYAIPAEFPRPYRRCGSPRCRPRWSLPDATRRRPAWTAWR